MTETMPSSLSVLGLGKTHPYTPEATLELGGVQCKQGCTRRLVQEVTKLNVHSGKPATAARERPARWDWAHSDKGPTRTVKTESLQPSQNTILTEECVVFPELTTGHAQSMFWSQIDALIGHGKLETLWVHCNSHSPKHLLPQSLVTHRDPYFQLIMANMLKSAYSTPPLTCSVRKKKHTPKFANLPTPSPFYQRAHTLKSYEASIHCLRLSRRSLGCFKQLTTYVRLLGR